MCYISAHSYEGYQEPARHALALNEWEVPDDRIIVGFKLNEGWKMLSFVGMWAVTCTAAIVIVVIVEIRITAYFSNLASSNASRSATRKMHQDFHKALLAMAITPLVTSTVPILYYVVAAVIKLNPGPVQCFLSMAATSITMFNPITTVLFMRCYRRVVIGRCLREKTSNSVTATTITGLSIATAEISPAVSGYSAQY
ncbi:hypothetical protein AAVH_28576 [Aphelenchoides avenae]|nr:hypothetical protein AAVH_28576 [Aphelenchus avenae]